MVAHTQNKTKLYLRICNFVSLYFIKQIVFKIRNGFKIDLIRKFENNCIFVSLHWIRKTYVRIIRDYFNERLLGPQKYITIITSKCTHSNYLSSSFTYNLDIAFII